jgi:hypothetical protein
MINHPVRRLVLLALILLIVLTLAACGDLSPDDLSRESGQRARQVVDQLLEQLGQFVAGFCSAAIAPVALVAVVARTRPQRGR